MKRNYNVFPSNREWAENAQRAIKITPTQAEAIVYAKEMAKNQQSELLIHGRESKIREKNSYGADPYTPRLGYE